MSTLSACLFDLDGVLVDTAKYHYIAWKRLAGELGEHAQVELGRYDDAVATAQEMADRRPDFASYARVSYLRELHGDIDGAISAMERAAAAAGTEYDEAWALVQLGNLRLIGGDLDAAMSAYDRAALSLPDDAMVLAARASIANARGDLAGAESLLRRAVEQRPLPEYATALGELLESQGRAEESAGFYATLQRRMVESGDPRQSTLVARALHEEGRHEEAEVVVAEPMRHFGHHLNHGIVFFLRCRALPLAEHIELNKQVGRRLSAERGYPRGLRAAALAMARKAGRGPLRNRLGSQRLFDRKDETDDQHRGCGAHATDGRHNK